jgi:hypothetical protein
MFAVVFEWWERGGSLCFGELGSPLILKQGGSGDRRSLDQGGTVSRLDFSPQVEADSR